MFNFFKSRRAIENLGITDEAQEKIAMEGLRYVSHLIINLLEQVYHLSKWLLAGSLTSSFTILISLKELKSFYD